MNIMIDRNATRASGQNILNAVSDIQAQIKKLENAANTLTTVWNGEDGKICSETLKLTYVKQLKKLADAAQTYGEYLKNVEQVYNTFDDTFADKNIGV